MSGTPTSEDSRAPHGDKWPRTSATPIVEQYHRAIRRLMADRLASSGRKWEEVVHDPDFLSRPDFERIEADLLATGYRFEMSAVVSLKESPEKYKPVAEREVAESSQTDELGRAVVGSGANVFRADHDVTGTARFVSSVEKVMELLSEGVPEDTIAVIDDSGGTLTAPILGEFAGVICLGGTVRSHLGILTREHGVPCLMAATLDGLRDGDEVEVEYSRPAADAYATAEDGAEHRARIIKLS